MCEKWTLTEQQRTGHADLPHPALGQNFTPSPTARRAQAEQQIKFPVPPLNFPDLRKYFPVKQLRESREKALRHSGFLPRNHLLAP